MEIDLENILKESQVEILKRNFLLVDQLKKLQEQNVLYGLVNEYDEFKELKKTYLIIDFEKQMPESRPEYFAKLVSSAKSLYNKQPYNIKVI